MGRLLKFRCFDTEKKIMIQDVSPVQREGVEVMQYCGLLDKNMKEVYEGDILMLPNPYHETVDVGVGPGVVVAELPGAEFGVVVFKDGAFGVDMQERTHDVEKGFNILSYIRDEGVEFEIVGNKFENPELLTNTYGK